MGKKLITIDQPTHEEPTSKEKYKPHRCIAENVAGSFTVFRCATQGSPQFNIDGLAGTGAAGKTVELFRANGGKVAEVATVGSDGRFSGTITPPNPTFNAGDVVVIRIGDHIGRCTAT